MFHLLIHDSINPFIHACLDKSLCKILLSEKSRQRREKICQISLLMHLKTDSSTSNIPVVSCRDETSPGGYFAFLLAVKGILVLRAVLGSVPDKEMYLS